MTSDHHHDGAASTAKQSPVAVVAVPYPGQGHLNQMLQLSCLISGYGLPVYYVGSAVHNRQVQARINSLNPQQVAKLHFHDLPLPTFPSPPPNPNSPIKYPTHCHPLEEASLHLRRPFAAFLLQTAATSERVAVVHDHLMSYVVQDVAGIKNAESYQLLCISAFSSISFLCGFLGLPFPLPHPKELPPFHQWASEESLKFMAMQSEPSDFRSGNLFNTSRSIEGPYMEFIERNELENKRPTWAIGPLLPSPNHGGRHDRSLEWLDKQEAKSVIYISFGTTVSLSDSEVKELAHGLRRSGVKFLWVLRDADRGDIFEGGERKVELPGGFGEGGGGEGMVVREWAPQPQILAHPSVGGFMSHCGWNSCIESIAAGVAMAAWPMHSDQPINAALVADVLGTGIVVREWKERDEVVKAARIESVVRRLMASEEGEEMRKRAEEVGAAVRRSAEPGGASRLDLDSFIAYITRDR